MTDAGLSPALAHRLQQTLGQWRQWRCDTPLPHCPEVLGVLGGGESNTSVLVRAGTGFVVRLDDVSPAALGLNRQSEWRALQSAHRQGLAPAPRYFNPELGALVCDYLPPDEPRRHDAAAVAALLRGIHRLPLLHQRLDPGERLHRYLRLLHLRDQSCGLEPRDVDRVTALLNRVQADAPPAVLCHNDLLPANRLLSGGRLWALDWEYCARGDPWFDLAVVAVGAEDDPQWQRAVLEHYLDRPAAGSDWRRLHAFACIYRCLELLWYALAAPPDAAARRGRLQRLRSALSKADAGEALPG